MTVPASGNLVIEDSSGANADTLTIDTDANGFLISDTGGNNLSTDIATATGDGTSSIFVPFAAVTGTEVWVRTGDGNDAITVGSAFDPGNTFDLDIDGQGGTDRIVWGTSSRLNTIAAAAETIDFDDNVLTVGNQTWDGDILLDRNLNTRAEAGVIDFKGTIDGAYSLSVIRDGAGPVTTILRDAVGATTPLTSLGSSRASWQLEGGGVTTTGGQDYDGDILLDAAGNATVLESMGGANIDLGLATSSFIRSATDGEESLTLRTSGSTDINARIGNNGQRLASFTTDGGGTTYLDNLEVNTTGDQTYKDVVVIKRDMQLRGDTVRFHNTTDANAPGSKGITVTGNLEIGDSGSDQVGANEPLEFITVSGTTVFDTDATVATSGDQNYTGTVTLNHGPTLTADDVTFSASVNSQIGEANSLTLNVSGVADFQAEVGGTATLGELNVNGAAKLAGDVTTLHGQTYGDALTLATDVILNNGQLGAGDAGAIDLQGIVNSEDATPRSLQVYNRVSGNQIILGGAIGGVFPLSSIVVHLPEGGSGRLDGGTVTTTGEQIYWPVSTLGADTTLTGSKVHLNGDLQGTTAGQESLSIVGDVKFGNGGSDRFGTTAAFEFVEVSGSTEFRTTSSVVTTGSQTYSDPVTLSRDSSLTSTDGGEIAFESTLDGNLALTVNTNGATVFEGRVGGTTALASLTTDAGGSTKFNDLPLTSVNVETTGAIDFGDSVEVSGALHIDAGGAVRFRDTLDGDDATIRTVGGQARFDGNIGGFDIPASLDTSGSSSVDFNGDSVTTSGDQQWGALDLWFGPATFAAADAGANVRFRSTVNGPADLIVNASGETSFEGDVGVGLGVLSRIQSLTTDAAGTTVIGAGTTQMVAGLGAATFTFNDSVILEEDVTIVDDGSGVYFNNTLDGAHSLVVQTGATTRFSGRVGGTTPLANLTTDPGGTTEFSNIASTFPNVRTTGEINLNDAVDVTGALHIEGGGGVTFASTLDGLNSQIQTFGGKVTFEGAIGDNNAPFFFSSTGSPETEFNGRRATTSGHQAWGALTLPFGSATLEATGANRDVRFLSTVDGAAFINVKAKGTTRFQGDVGATLPIGSLTTDAAGTTTIDTGTTLLQSIGTATFIFNDPVILEEDVTIVDIGGTGVFFNDTLDGAHSLTVNADATTYFGDKVGRATALTNLLVTGPGSTTLTDDVFTTGPQTFSENVTLAGNVLLDVLGNSTVTVNGTINGAFRFQVNTAGSTVFGGKIGDTTRLDSVTVTVPGATTLADDVLTTGNQTYAEDVTLAGDVVLDTSGGSLSFRDTIDSDTSAARSLVVNSTGVANLDGAIGQTNALNSLTINGVANVRADVTTLLTQNFSDTTDVLDAVTLAGTEIVFSDDLSLDGGSAGQTNIAADVTIGTGGTYEVDLNGATNDVISVMGPGRTVDVTGVALDVTQVVAASPGDQYVIIDNVDATSSVSGVFDLLPEGTVFDVDGTSFRISYEAGEDGNDVVLTAQQEVGFSITSRTVSESIGSFDIVVTAAQPFSRNVSIPLTIAGNAVNGADFDIDETHGTLDFLAGNTAATLSVGIIDDRNYEPGTESFTVTLGAAPEISLGSNSAVTVTIIDNDALPTVSMRNANRPIYVTEGHTYTVSASLSAPSTSTVTVPLFAGGRAGSQDYSFLTSSTLTFAPGRRTAYARIRITDDTVAEGYESLYVTMGSPSGALRNGRAARTILNIRPSDTASVNFAYSGRTVDESAGTVRIPVTLSRTETSSVSVPYFISSRSGRGGPVTNTTNGTLTIPGGQRTGYVSLNIINDSINEPDQYAYVSLGTPTGGLRGRTTRFRLLVRDNDVSYVSFTSSGTTVYENAGSVQFTARLSRPAAIGVSVPIYVSGQLDGSVSRSPLYFAPGQTQVTRTITIPDDSHRERTETAYVQLRSTSEVRTYSRNRFRLAVLDNDAEVSLSGGRNFSETGSTTFTVRLSNRTNRDVLVPIRFGGSAYHNRDYRVRLNGVLTSSRYPTLRIPAGQTSGTVSVTAINDSYVERTESVSVYLGSPTNASLIRSRTGRSRAVYLYDNDRHQTANVSFSHTTTSDLVSAGYTSSSYRASQLLRSGRRSASGPATQYIDEGGYAYVTVVLSRSVSRTTSVSVRLSRYSRASTSDHSFRHATVTFRPGETRKTIRIRTYQDSRREGTESIRLYIGSTSSGISRPRTGNSYTTNIRPSDQYRGNYYRRTTGGYFVGSTVFYDANGNETPDFVDLNDNGILDDDEFTEVTTTTAIDGTFDLELNEDYDTNLDGEFGADEARLVVTGGIDAATNLPFIGQFTALPDEESISSLSTLTASLVDLGLEPAEARQRIVEAFELADDTDLVGTDLLQETLDGDLDSAQVFATSAQFFNSTIQIGSLFGPLADSPGVHQLVSMAYDDLAAKILDPDGSFDLTEAADVRGWIDGVAVAAGLTGSLSDTDLDAAAEVIAASNLAIAEITIEATKEYLEEIVRVETVAQGIAATALGELALGNTDAATVLADYTGANLQTAVSAAEIGIVIQSKISITDVTKTELDSGQTQYDFVVSLDQTQAEAISVEYATADDSATTADGDYAEASGTLTWTPGDTSDRTVSVVVTGDTAAETDELFVVNLSNPTNAVLSKAVGEGWILNNDDRTYTAVADEEPNEIILTVGEAATSLRDGDVELFDGPQANPLALAITGEDEADDTFIVDFAENTFRSDIVTFDGGSDGMDAVEAESGDFASVTHTLVSPTDGSTVFVPLADLEDADENFTLNSTGIESYLLNVGTVEALILELPAFVTDAILEDADPTDTENPGMMQLRSASGSFLPIVFTVPEESITIRGAGSESVTVGDLDPEFTGTVGIASASPPTIHSATTDALTIGAKGTGDLVSFTANVSGVDDEALINIDWGDGTSSPGTLAGTQVTGSREYDAGGIYTVTITITGSNPVDDPVSATATAIISGVSIQNNTLNVIGTNGTDQVIIQRRSASSYLIRSNTVGILNVDPADFTSIYIQLGDGNDRFNALGTFETPLIVDAGAGNDRLVGSRGGDVLLGGPGNDYIWAGSGNNIVIGGTGRDFLFGGSGTDLLIGGTTDYDQNAGVLRDLQAEWTADRSVQQRVANLYNGSGTTERQNGDNFLTVGTGGSVQNNDGDRDLLFGGANMDWLFYDSGEDIAYGALGDLLNNDLDDLFSP